MKKKREIITQSYLNITDIQILFSVPSFYKAKEIYHKAEEMEKGYRPYDHKVKTQNVCKVLGIRLPFLRKQLESEEK